ncbi:MAG: metallophosphoesterase [Chloroflexi bacterium]|nr:metallophosphoesterase [Chloroflexota bacterium]
MKATWLHVSDFHFRGGDPYDRDVVLRALVKSVRYFRENGRKADLVFATGDVAYHGRDKEYNPATKFFDDLLEAAGLERCHLFLVPGNHDVDRTKGAGLTRTLATREEADAYFAPEAPHYHMLKLHDFREWYNDYFKGTRGAREDSTCGVAE